MAVVLLCLAGVAGLVPDALRILAGPITPVPDLIGRPTSPVYAYDLPRGDEPLLERPVSVVVARERIYVSDSLAGHVAVFRPAGTLLSTVGEDRLGIPLYVAVDEERDEIFVTDREHAAILVFEAGNGSFVETLTPTVDGTATVEPWAPLAIDVADDGSLYVTDIAGPHRIWHIDRSGRRLGMLPSSAEATGTASSGSSFDYPNAVKSLGERVWVADSNNRRLVEFDASGEQVRSLPLGRLIRGFDVVMAEEGGPVYFALVDAFSHQVVIVSETGSEISRIGEPGSGEGQLAFPNDVAIAGGIAWVADTGNARVQAWEWNGAAQSAALALWPGGPTLLGALAALLLLSPLLLLLNLRPVTVTVSGQILPALRDAAGDTRVWSRVRLLGTPSAEIVADAYPWLPPVRESAISRSDAAIVREVYQLDVDQAETLTLALRTRSLLTDDPMLARLGRARGLDVYDADSFITEFSTLWKGYSDPGGGQDSSVTDGK